MKLGVIILTGKYGIIKQRINKLIEDTKRSPFEGIGKPEPLKGNLAGLWSRRIDDKNRLIYTVDDVYLTIISCRNNY
jgi:toxin YoeB